MLSNFTSPGPWVWEVNERWLVTIRRLWPKNGGDREMARCGIVADFADRDTAEQYVTRHNERLQHMVG